LFATLRDYGWIQRADDSWSLTSKGEFEGGSYHSSRRYGSYIVWPETLLEHPLLQAIESNQRVTAGSLCRHYPHLDPRQINRAFAELGLQQHTLMGWELTEPGRALGGFQEESTSSGALYVTWPPEIADHPVVSRELGLLSEQAHPGGNTGDSEPDLFAAGPRSADPRRGVDGHQLQTPLEARVCNWLYMAQLAHAYRRALPIEELLYADFYLPEGNVYIDCWEKDAPAAEMKARLRKKTLYGELKLRSLEVNEADADKLDEVLGRGLLGFGIRY
jgi:hypothetical protein